MESIANLDARSSGIDVCALAKLEHMDCRDNYNLINVYASGCTRLQTLSAGIDSLTSLDVSGCGALRQLWIQQNQVTSLEDLNVTGCTNLQTLWCYNPGLTNLNITGCTNLLNLYAGGSPISDLSSLLTLAAHGGLATNAYVDLRTCPLTDYAINVQIPILKDTYGVPVDIEPLTPLP